MVLTLELVPGDSLGPFCLAQDINSVVRFLHRHNMVQQRRRLRGLRTAPSSQSSSVAAAASVKTQQLLSTLIGAATVEMGVKRADVGCDRDWDQAITASATDYAPPENHFSSVEILYDRQRPLDRDLIVRLCEEAITLRFEPRTQRLRRIDLDIAKRRVQLSYRLDNDNGTGGSGNGFEPMDGSTVFCAPDMDPTFVKIYQVFGPTYPGTFDKKSGQYYLSYPGVTFVFPIPEQFSRIFEEDDQAIPLELPNGSTPIATKIYIFMGYKFQEPTLPPLQQGHDAGACGDDDSETEIETKSGDPVSADKEKPDGSGSSSTSSRARMLPPSLLAPATATTNYFEEVYARIGHGIRFATRDREVLFGDSPQQVIMAIGRPDDIYFKRHNKLRIHAIASQQNLLRQRMSRSRAGSSSSEKQGPPGTKGLPSSLVINKNQQSATDYFFNYFGLGLDIMFDGSSHAVRKIILHTNFPGSRNFNIYAKCNFRLANTITGENECNSGGDSCGKDSGSLKRRRLITPDMRFRESIHAILGGDSTPHSRPLVNDHTQQMSPFGGTRYFAYRGVIFEVMKNDHLSSLQLFV